MDIERAVLILKMMANPIRLQILKTLIENDPGICVGGIEEKLNIPQSSVSQHLAHLRNCGILGCKKNGKNVCYSIIDPAVSTIMTAIAIEDGGVINE